MGKAILSRIVFVLHDRLRPDQVEARRYQLELAKAADQEPLLLVLPTGLGKTAVALMTILRRWEQEPEARVLVLAPTKPLVEQHARFFRQTLTDAIDVAAVTGEDPPSARRTIWTGARIVCSTPQVVRNDILRGTLDLDAFGMLVLDEAHRGVGNYAYVFIAQRFKGHRLGLSASPGSDATKIRRVLENLRLARTEIRSETDADVRPYVHDVETEWVRVTPNAELVHTARLLQKSLSDTILGLRRIGYLDRASGQPSRKLLIEMGQRLRAEAARGTSRSSVYQALSLQARALKIEHALELCETQGPGPLARFLERTLRESERAGGSKAARDWAATPEFMQALTAARAAKEPHPKVAKLLQIVKAQVHGSGTRVLVFANYRETADDLVARLEELDGVRPARFVGHAKASTRKGLTKKEQQRVVDEFRNGRTNVLVATSVGEEGLDLPDCDAVVLFEPVASGIRMIQRRGRTGRHRDGSFFVLMTEGTRDAAYYWSAKRRERRMNTELRSMRRLPAARVEPALPSPMDAAPKPNAPSVVVDTREFQSPLVRRLVDDGFRVKSVQMETGDYRIGEGVVVERKTAKDLAASIVDGRFFDQVERLGRAGRGVMLVEGSMDRAGALSRNALAGAVASALLDHGVSLVMVPDGQTSADLLAAMARRSAGEATAGRASRVEKAPVDSAGLVSHLIQGLPGIGPSLAQRLAARFGSLAALCEAPQEALASVEGIGDRRAAEIHRAVRTTVRPSGVDAVAAEGLALKAGDGAAG